jgi:hypothetical protein
MAASAVASALCTLHWVRDLNGLGSIPALAVLLTNTNNNPHPCFLCSTINIVTRDSCKSCSQGALSVNGYPWHSATNLLLLVQLSTESVDLKLTQQIYNAYNSRQPVYLVQLHMQMLICCALSMVTQSLITHKVWYYCIPANTGFLAPWLGHT